MFLLINKTNLEKMAPAQKRKRSSSASGRKPAKSQKKPKKVASKKVATKKPAARKSASKKASGPKRLSAREIVERLRPGHKYDFPTFAQYTKSFQKKHRKSYHLKHIKWTNKNFPKDCRDKVIVRNSSGKYEAVLQQFTRATLKRLIYEGRHPPVGQLTKEKILRRAVPGKDSKGRAVTRYRYVSKAASEQAKKNVWMKALAKARKELKPKKGVKPNRRGTAAEKALYKRAKEIKDSMEN